MVDETVRIARIVADNLSYLQLQLVHTNGTRIGYGNGTINGSGMDYDPKNITASSLDKAALGVQLAYKTLNDLMLEPLGANVSLSEAQQNKTSELVYKLDSAFG
jgi:hypothetical protein